MQSNPSIAIVVSTYNGERHIKAQIESLLAQSWSNREIFVRDDGSTDGTVDILKSFASEGAINLTIGKNAGVVASFFDSINAIPDNYDFIALCDQDDVWHPEKLERAIEQLSQLDNETPLLYCSNLTFCNESLTPEYVSNLNRRGIDFCRMLYETVCFGNTMVFNRSLAKAAVSHGVEGVVSHDWWIALVASALGVLYFDNNAYIDYRRTGGNVSAAGRTGLSLFAFRIKTFLLNGQMKSVEIQLRRFAELYGNDLDSEKKTLLSRFCNGGRFAKAFFPKRLRQKTRDDIMLRIMFLLGL